MVATVLRIRFAILGNVLGASPWQIVAYVVGAIGALWLVAAAGAGLLFASASGPVALSLVITGGGALLVLGWVLGPLIAAGVDTTVDAGRLAPFPLTSRQVMLSLTTLGLVGIPGIATALGSLVAIAAWWRWPAALVAAVVCIPVGVLTCVVASRLVTSFFAGGRGRRATEVLGLVLLAVLMLSGPLVVWLMSAVDAATRDDPIGSVASAVDIASWTPVGAVWAVPGELAAGRPLAALAKLLIGSVTLALLWLLWRRRIALASAGAVSRAVSRARGDRRGWFGVLPTGGLGGTWARSLTYWLRDPRYLRQLLIVPLLPVLIGFWGGAEATPVFVFSGVLIALILGFVPYADVSYDGTAFAGVVAAGVRGRTDRAGRLLAAGSVALPLVLAVSAVTVGVADRWWLMPAVAGAAVGVLLVAYGVSSISSALLVVPVPQSGDNPFKRVPGTTLTMGLAVFGILVATALLGAPAYVPAIIAAVTGDVTLAWITLVVGVGYGLAFAIGGVLAGGAAFDRTAPALLARLRAMKGV